MIVIKQVHGAQGGFSVTNKVFPAMKTVSKMVHAAASKLPQLGWGCDRQTSKRSLTRSAVKTMGLALWKMSEVLIIIHGAKGFCYFTIILLLELRILIIRIHNNYT